MIRLLFTFLMLPAICFADTYTSEWLKTTNQELEQIAGVAASWSAEETRVSEVESLQQRIIELHKESLGCIGESEKLIAVPQAKLDALGEADASEGREIAQQRKALESEKGTIGSRLAKCKLLEIEILNQLEKTDALRKSMISNRLANRSMPIWQAVGQFNAERLQGFFIPRLRQVDSWSWLIWFALALIALMPMSFVIGRQLCDYERRQDDEASRLRFRLAGMYGRRLIWFALFLCSSAALWWFGAIPLAAYLLAFSVALATSPLIDAILCIGQKECHESRPARVVWTLALFALTTSSLPLAFPEQPGVIAIILEFVFLFLLFASTSWLLIALSRRGPLFGSRRIHWPLIAILLVGPLAFALGYHNLGIYLSRALYGSLLIALAAWLVYFALLHLLDEYPQPQDDAESAPPGNGEDTGERMSWRRALVLSGVVLIAFVLMVRYWSVAPQDATRVLQLLTLPYNFGGFTIVPSRWLFGLFIFVLFWTMSRFLAEGATRYWHVKDATSRGARQSVVKLSGYAIIAIGLLVGLSVAGLELGNLAIVAGALSVGIGFGLQNIVNNFVSGLILLFERPIRPGDWVQVGSTEGYVRQVRIRSTIIETFDRAEILVPNSDLISNHVLNRTFSDSFGRIRIAVGVAYGTSTYLVQETLLQVAKNHPLVLTNDPKIPVPRVLFMAFGDSSLDFELRCYIRDIEYSLSVSSDLRFAINDAFIAKGIEIPFPQRVLHTANDTSVD